MNDAQDPEATSTVTRLEAVEAENQALRERIDALEAGLTNQTGETAEEADDQYPGNHTSSDEGATAPSSRVVPSEGQAYKVVGELDDEGGVGVFGHNTAESGSSVGVWGEVDAPTGYGLYTPNGARIDSDLEVGEKAIIDDDLVVNANDSDGISNILFQGLSTSNPRLFLNPDFNEESYLGLSNSDVLWIGTDRVEINSGYLTFPDGTPQRTAGPIAKGYISYDGSIDNGVNISHSEWNDEDGWYEVILEDETYWPGNFALSVTPDGAGTIPAVRTGVLTSPNRITVRFEGDIQKGFSIVVHDL